MAERKKPAEKPRRENEPENSAPSEQEASEAQPESVRPPADVPSWLGLAIAAAVPILFFFLLPPLSKSGLWDPYELSLADLARRIALNLFHAGSLALTGADNSLPHLNDLGRPELPITSMALGFRFFGLHEWAGRLPMAVWGTAGVLITYAFVARLVDRRAGIYSAIALCTMPLFFVQARTMIGDIVTMSAFAMAFGGGVVAVFDRKEQGPTVSVGRIAFALVSIVGAVAGYYSRGLILGVAAPLGGVGLAYLATLAAGRKVRDAFGDAFGAIAMTLSAWALYRGWKAIGSDDMKNLSMAVGAMIKPQSKYPTYDVVIGHLGHALAPWSAFIPFAFGRLLGPPFGRTGIAGQRESFTRAALLLGAAAAYGAHAMMAPRTELIPFAGVCVFAAACGVALRDYERGAAPSVAVGVGTVLLAGIFHHDFHELPEKAFQAFGVTGAVFPESFKDQSLVLWWIALGGFAVLLFLTFIENRGVAVAGGPVTASARVEPVRRPFEAKRYIGVIRQLREAWDGLLALAYFAMVAGSSIAGLVIWMGARSKAQWVAQISIQIRDGILNAWWITAAAPFVFIFGILFLADVWLWAFDQSRPFAFKQSIMRGFEPIEELFANVKKVDLRSGEWLVQALVLVPLMVLVLPAVTFFALYKQGAKLPLALAVAIPSSIVAMLLLGFLGDLFHKRGGRVAAFGVGSTAVGLVLCLQYYPALANQLSPKEVFESYERKHCSGEPIALFGVGGRTAAYYAGGQPEIFSDPQTAFQWLMAGGTTRRFLAVRADELGRLNMLYRQRAASLHQPLTNLPVLDARSSQIVLVASSLESPCGPAEKNQSPFDKIILNEPPKPQRPLNVNMDGKLLVLGVDITDANGRLVDSIAPGRKFHFRVYYKVLAPVGAEWEAFIHIDGYHRRHNGDHKVMNGKYPFALWNKDDLLVDDHEMTLEPNFSPGMYTIYFGLFLGETRLRVLSGPNDGENRIVGGQIRVQ
jgi:hypothetical protein